MIRFLKNCKAFCQNEIKLNSFDINAICYDIDKSKYQNSSFIELVPIIYSQLKNICANNKTANDIVSVDGREYIFRYSPSKLENLKLLMAELEVIYNDLKQETGTL